LLIIFIGLLTADVLGKPGWLLALVVHLMPSFVLIVLTFIAWKNRKLGGILFLFTGLISIGFYHSFIIAGPAFVVGVLFLISNYRL
jgi:hypothetical protein